MILFLENVFYTLIVNFCENQTVFKIGKVAKFDKETLFCFEKKRCHPSKRHFEQNWWAENMPVLAGRLVAHCVVLLFLLAIKGLMIFINTQTLKELEF